MGQSCIFFNPVFSFSAPSLVPTFSNLLLLSQGLKKGGEPWGLKCKHSNCTWPLRTPIRELPRDPKGPVHSQSQLLKLDASTISSGSKRKMTEGEMCKQGMHARPFPSSPKRNNNRERAAHNGRLPPPRHRDKHPAGKFSRLSITLRPGPRSHLHPSHASHQEKGENCEMNLYKLLKNIPFCSPQSSQATFSTPHSRGCPDLVSSLQGCSFPASSPNQNPQTPRELSDPTGRAG